MANLDRSWMLAVSLFVVGCSASPAPVGGSGVACEPNPEAVMHPQALSANGQQLQGLTLNGLTLNGTQLQGLTLNGLTLNGTQLQGTQLQGVNLKGTLLQGVTNAGRIVSGADFVGTKLTGVLSDGRTIDLVISSFAEEGRVAYYTLEAAGQDICGAGGRGLFVSGVWDSTGARHDTLTVGGNEIGVSFSCTDGVIAKCVAWGYEPSNVGADLHQSCTRMARADYCGTGVSFTKNGTLIDIFDTRGVQQPTAGDASLVFEAAWTTSGAGCVSRTRYEALNPSGALVLPSCWDRLPKCASWSEAQGQGALLGNASRIQSRSLCK